MYMGPAAPQANTDRRPKALGNAVFTAEGQEVAACPRRLLSTSALAQLLPPRKEQGGRGRAPGHLPEAPSRASASEAGSAATPGGEGPSRRAPVHHLTLTVALSSNQEGVGEAQGAPLLAGSEAGLSPLVSECRRGALGAHVRPPFVDFTGSLWPSAPPWTGQDRFESAHHT